MTILISATIDIDPAHARRIIEDARPLIEASLQEPGCEAYSWALNPLHQGRVEVFERWINEAALARHFTLPNYKDMAAHLESAGPITAVSRKYRVDHDEPVYDDAGTPRADFFTLPVTGR